MGEGSYFTAEALGLLQGLLFFRAMFRTAPISSGCRSLPRFHRGAPDVIGMPPMSSGSIHSFVPPCLRAYDFSMILLIDNYDSFTYNLVQRIGEIDPNMELRVFRNDKITQDQAVALSHGRRGL